MSATSQVPRLGHHRDALVVHQGAVLDRVHAGPDRPLDALGAVRVRRHVRAVQRRPPRPRRGSGPRSARARRGRSVSDITAPVAISLIRSAPPYRIRRTARVTSSTVSTTPTRSSAGTCSSASGARPLMSPPPPRQPMKAPATIIRGPGRPAGVDRVAQGDVDEGAVVADVAHAGEPGVQGVARVAHAGHGLLRAGARQHLGVALPAVDLAHEVGVAVDQAGQQGRAGQVEDGGVGGRLVRGHDGGDPVTVDDDGAVGEQVAGRRRRAAARDGRRGCRSRPSALVPRAPGTRVVPQTASGAPSQQLAFMWQCGHSQRVEMGSNSTPQ